MKKLRYALYVLAAYLVSGFVASCCTRAGVIFAAKNAKDANVVSIFKKCLVAFLALFAVGFKW